MTFREGAVEFGHFRTWYKRVGNITGGTPLLVLHGGPGFPHDYLTTLDRLADQREVIFYDQLGCGHSSTQDPPDEWSISLFVEELANLRVQLGLELVHLFGHSWGGWLAMEYALRGPGELMSLVLASAPASVPEFIIGIDDLVAGLSRRSRRVLNRHRAGEAVGEKKFHMAYNEFLHKHWCRVDPLPAQLTKSWMASASVVYEALWGPSEMVADGPLATWDVSAELGSLDLPVLMTCGAHDEVRPQLLKRMLESLPNADLKVYPNSAHMAHLEETEPYLSDLSRFLQHAEEQSGVRT